MVGMTRLIFLTAVSGVQADVLGSLHPGSSHLGLIGTGQQQGASLGPLAKATALEPSLVASSQHIANLIAHKSISSQVPDNPHPTYKIPVDKKATVKVGSNGAGFVGSGRAPKLQRAPVGISAPPLPSLPEPPEPPTLEDVENVAEDMKNAAPEIPEVPVPDLAPALPDPPKSAVPKEWGQRKCFYLMLLLLCFCGCFGAVAQQEHGLHIGSAVATTPAFFLLGYMFTQTDIMWRFWRGEQVGWWCAILCFWASGQLIFGVSVLAVVGVGEAKARKQKAAEAQAESQA